MNLFFNNTLNDFDNKFIRLCKDLLHKINYDDLDDIMK